MFHSCDELFWLYFKSQVLEKKVCSKWMYSVSWSWNFDFPQLNVWKKEIKNERHGCLDFVYVTAINRTVRWLVFLHFQKLFSWKKSDHFIIRMKSTSNLKSFRDLVTLSIFGCIVDVPSSECSEKNQTCWATII